MTNGGFDSKPGASNAIHESQQPGKPPAGPGKQTLTQQLGNGAPKRGHAEIEDDRMDVDEDPAKRSKGNSGAAAGVSFKLSANKSTGAYTQINEKAMGAAPGNVPRTPVGYMVQVPTDPGGGTPSAIAAKYEAEAFDDPKQAPQRMRLAVGVNGYRDVDDANRGVVKAKVDGAASKVHGAAFGFLWDPMWEKTLADPGGASKAKGKGKGTVTEMTATEVAADPDAQKLKAQDHEYFSKQEKNQSSGATKQGKVPYGRIRDYVKNHNATARLTKELAAQHDSVYVHLGDDDAKSLLARTKADAAKEAKPNGLMSRYDQVIADHNQPDIATGGYEFKRQQDGGDLPDHDPKVQITLIAHELDRKVRDILVAHLGAFAQYFPEPNTVFRVTSGNSKLEEDAPDKNIFHDPNSTKSGGSAESQEMVKNLRRAQPGATAAYDPGASVVTETSPRFREGEGTFGKALDTGVVDPALIKHVVGQNQSHASSGVWIDAVMQGTAGGNTKISEPFVKAVINAFTVTGSDFNRKSQKKFTDQEMQTFLTETLTKAPAGQLDKKYDTQAKSDVGQKIIAAATASNTAIVEAIQQTLELVKAQKGHLTIKGHDEKKK